MENVQNQRLRRLYHFSPHLYAALRVAYGWTVAKRHNTLRRIMNVCDCVLMDEYRIPSRTLRHFTRRIARYVGDICVLLRTSSSMVVHKLCSPNWTIIVVGSEASKRQLCHLFSEEGIQMLEMERVAPSELPRRAQTWLATDASLVICELGRAYPKRFTEPVTFTVPSWIDQTISLPPSPDDLLAGTRSSSRRRRTRIHHCIKAGYVSRFSQSEDDLAAFYYDIYVPAMEQRHGELGILTSYESCRRVFRLGGLLLVMLDGQPVAGKLCYCRNGIGYGGDVGVSVKDPKYLKEGVHAIVDWYFLLWAYEQGATAVHMGGTRSWYSDGVFLYKSRWGAKAGRRAKIYSEWTMLSRSVPKPLQERMNDIGFVTEIDGRFFGICLADDPSSLSTADISERLSTMETRCLDGFAIISPSAEPVIHEIAHGCAN
jgi:hypothetical protein